MVERANRRTSGHQPGASPGPTPTAREIARFERFVAERKPALDAMSPDEVDAMTREALKQVDKKQFLREAKALRDGMKERQAAREAQERAMVERARHRTNEHQSAPEPHQPTKREIARFERFIASRRPITAVMPEAEADARLREALKHVDKKQFLREAKALREQMKERQAALVQSRPKRNSAKRD